MKKYLSLIDLLLGSYHVHFRVEVGLEEIPLLAEFDELLDHVVQARAHRDEVLKITFFFGRIQRNTLRRYELENFQHYFNNSKPCGSCI